MPRRWIRIVAMVVALFCMALLLGLPSPHPGPRETGVSTLRIATANISFDNTRPADASRVLANLDVDFLFVQEWTGNNLDLDLLRLASLEPVLNEPRRGTHGLLVLARNPAQVRASLVSAPVAGPCPMPLAAVRIHDAGSALSILGVHVPPPVRACDKTTKPTLRAIASWVVEGKLAVDVGVARQEDVVIVLGDFNAMSQSGDMRNLRQRGMTDAYVANHWRPGPTYKPSRLLPSLIRIDYLLVPPNIEVRGSWNLSLPGSDHRMVMAELMLVAPSVDGNVNLRKSG